MNAIETTPYQGNRPRTTLALQHWHASAPAEQALELALPIVDAHHHLFGTPQEPQFYQPQDLAMDLSSGHRILGTVWVEAYESGWRTDGPPEMRSLGEVDRIAAQAATPTRTPWGDCQVAAAMVSNVDLTLGDAAARVLDAHLSAAQGRLRGVRHHTQYDAGVVGRIMKNFKQETRPHLLGDAQFRRGIASLHRLGLSFDALLFHTQLDELAALADAFPDLPIVLNHVGTFIGVAEYAPRRAAERELWDQRMRDLARRPNVHVKLGGMGMAVFGFGFEAGRMPAGSRELAAAWQPFIDTCIDAFGPERCMFESNFPVDKQSCGYTQLWNAFKLSSRALSPDERAHLFFRTACRVYRLPELEKICDKALTTTLGENP